MPEAPCDRDCAEAASAAKQRAALRPPGARAGTEGRDPLPQAGPPAPPPNGPRALAGWAAPHRMMRRPGLERGEMGEGRGGHWEMQVRYGARLVVGRWRLAPALPALTDHPFLYFCDGGGDRGPYAIILGGGGLGEACSGQCRA